MCYRVIQNFKKTLGPISKPEGAKYERRKILKIELSLLYLLFLFCLGGNERLAGLKLLL